MRGFCGSVAGLFGVRAVSFCTPVDFANFTIPYSLFFQKESSPLRFTEYSYLRFHLHIPLLLPLPLATLLESHYFAIVTLTTVLWELFLETCISNKGTVTTLAASVQVALAVDTECLLFTFTHHYPEMIAHSSSKDNLLLILWHARIQKTLQDPTI